MKAALRSLQRRDVVDAVLAAVLLVLGLLDLTTGLLQGAYPHSRWLHLPFLIASSVPLAFRRSRPLTALVAFAIAQTAWIFLLFPMDMQPPLVPYIELLLIVYAAAAYCDGRAARAAVLVVAVGILSDLPTLLLGRPIGNVAGPNLMVLIAFGIGLAFARIRRHAESLEEQAARAERERREAGERAAAEERARIARELHDVISHDVSMMVLAASVERRVRPEDDATTQTLATIESTGREALAELRRMLGVLRHTEESPLQPQPGIAQLPQVVEEARAAGVPVELVVEGEPATIPPGLDIAAYRIVQESLTNAAKHATGSPVTARVSWGADSLEIDVTNDGARPAVGVPLPRGGGHGLVGMQERVSLFGGTLEAGVGQDGGFRVRARLPIAA
ncbi:MAG: sensor histidine kinase [Actinomycetes bacterium]